MQDSSSNTEDYYSCNSYIEMNDADSDKQSPYDNIKDKENQIENLKEQTELLNEEVSKFLNRNTLLVLEISNLNKENSRLTKEKKIDGPELDLLKYELFELKK